MKIFITGANRGLGLAMVEVGLKKGHIVFAGVRSNLAQHTEQLLVLQKQYKQQLRLLHIDVSDEASIKNAAEVVKSNEHYLDVIINNAAILNERDKTIEELDIQACAYAFDVNTLGPMRIIKHFLPIIRAGLLNGMGKNQAIINISSEAASLTNAYSGDYPYGMSKVALNMLTEKLDVYLKNDGIRALSIHPGWMKTDMGGEKAPTDPNQTAENIFEMIETKPSNSSPFAFIDQYGNSMDI